MRQVELLVPAKHFCWSRPAFHTTLRDTDAGVEILVGANVFAKGVFLDFRDCDVVLSDNFFSITNGEPYRVTAKTTRTAEELERALEIKSIYDIR